MPQRRGPRARIRRGLTVRLRPGVLASTLGALVLAGCGGGGGVGGDNDGTFVSRTGVVVTGIADDGTETSPLDGATCRAVTAEGRELNRDTTDADGAFLLLVDPGQQVAVQCFADGQSNLRLQRFVSTEGLPEGGELPGQDVLPSTTVISRIVAQEAADDPALDVAARFDALAGTIVPFASDATPANPDLQLLADAFTVLYDRLRDAGADPENEALIADLYDDGDVDLELGEDLLADVNGALADLAAAAGRAVPDAVLATHPAFDLTVLSAGGGASNLLDVARFATVLRELRDAAEQEGGVLTLSAGDQIASRVELVPSFEDGNVFYDADVIDRLGYDVLTLGPQDLELGPAIAGAFLGELTGDAVAVVTDLATGNEAPIQNLASSGRVTGSLVFEERARRIGVVSYTGTDLNERTSLRRIGIFSPEDQLTRLRDAIEAARRAGARIVVLLAATDDEADVAGLLGGLSGIDLVLTLPTPVADADPPGGALLDPAAPATLEDTDGRAVPVLGTFPLFTGVRTLAMEFDPLGRMDEGAAVASARAVTADTPAADDLADAVVDPLAEALADLDEERAAEVRVALDGRAASVRNQETNFGNLVADAMRGSARSQANLFRSDAPRAMIVDAGVFVGDAEIPTGDLSRAEVFAQLRSGALVGVLQSVPPEDLKRLLETAVAARGTDRFVQVSGIDVEFDPDGTAQVLAADGTIETPGTRIVNVRITDDDFLVRDGAPVEDAPSIAVGLTDRLVATWPLGELTVVNVGITVAQALDAYVRVTLDRQIRNDDYPVGGTDRIGPVGD
jgi:5'-nucleotidase